MDATPTTFNHFQSLPFRNGNVKQLSDLLGIVLILPNANDGVSFFFLCGIFLYMSHKYIYSPPFYLTYILKLEINAGNLVGFESIGKSELNRGGYWPSGNGPKYICIAYFSCINTLLVSYVPIRRRYGDAGELPRGFPLGFQVMCSGFLRFGKANAKGKVNNFLYFVGSATVV